MFNPNLQAVAKGDRFISAYAKYESVVLKVGDIEQRFGQDDRILTVCVRSLNIDGSISNVVDASKLLWWSQLKKGLV
jgi:ACT domain-containing protein